MLVDSCWCSKIPAECSHADCAAVMRPGIQAYTALHYQLRIVKGDTVLVTRGYVGIAVLCAVWSWLINSNVSLTFTTCAALHSCYEGRQAMIQMAKHWGGRVFATAYSREEVHSLLGVLDEAQIIDLSR